MTKHVAAWDLPSLDYLSEEQTLKYLRKHEEDVRRREQQGRSSFAKIHTSPMKGCVNSASGCGIHGIFTTLSLAMKRGERIITQPSPCL